MWRMRYLVIAAVMWILASNSVEAQNPFDLKWRNNTTDTSTVNRIAPPAENVVPIIPPTPEETPVLPVDTIGATDTLTLQSDSAVLSTETSEDTTPDVTSDEVTVEIDEPDRSVQKPAVARPQAKQPIKAALIIVMIVLAILILTWSVNYNRGFIKQIYRAAMNENLSSLLLREQRFASSQYLYYIVYITFFINAALFLYLMVRRSNWDLPYATSPLLYFVLFVIGVYLTKHIVIKFIGSTFGIAEKTAHYNFTILLFNILAGIALIPINLLLAFGSASLAMPVIIVGLVIFGLLYLLRQFRGLVLVSDTLAGHGFQFFMYLCAIEILPILVLFKFFTTH